MIYQKINLFLFAVMGVVLFFTIPFYNNWLYSKVLNNDFAEEVNHLGIQDRNMKRFGYSYSVLSDVAHVLAQFKDVTVLLPPNDYVKTRGITDFIVPEPAVFYYFTGLRAVWVNSPDASLANWALIMNGPGNAVVKKMDHIRNSDSLIAVYKKYIN